MMIPLPRDAATPMVVLFFVLSLLVTALMVRSTMLAERVQRLEQSVASLEQVALRCATP